MKISIIIPVYGVELYIERCLQSLIVQTCNNFEVIIVNDATKDNSIQIAKQILTKSNFPITYIEHEQNGGLSQARNSGINVATGDYILFLDSDDALRPNAIELFINAINQTESDCIIGNYQVISEKTNYISSQYKETRLLNTPDAIKNNYCTGHIPITAWNKCIKKGLFFQSNLWFKPEIIHEDELWTFILINKISTLYLLGECTYIYYQRNNSIMTNSSIIKKLQSLVIIYEEMVSFIQKGKADQQLTNHLNLFSFNRYKDLFESSMLSNADKKYYYECFRTIQNKLKGFKLKTFLLRIHLHFPIIIGYYIMKFIVSLYKTLK